MTKVCFKCGIEQPLTEFYKHKQMADGHLNKCKTCTKTDTTTNRTANIDFYRQYDKERQQRPERRAKKSVYQSTQRTKYSNKYHARTMVGNAIRDGRLKKQPCEICGAIGVEAHHSDYYKPLEVRWLCQEHHKAFHAGQIELPKDNP